VNWGEIVLSVVAGWTVLSIIVALAVGGMAKARDVGSPSRVDVEASDRTTAPPRDDGFRVL
jgi:hypothetical protein